jgi:hypothetical protein
MIELHGKFNEFIGDACFLGNTAWGQEIIPAARVVLRNMEKPLVNHFGEKGMCKSYAATEFGGGHTVVETRGHLNMLEDFQLK